MKVLVDTGIWSLAFRRKQINRDEQRVVQQLQALVLEGSALMIGNIRQEVLSGIRHRQQYEKLKMMLRPFDDLAVTQNDYELAADMFNTCRSKGIQGSHIDFLICAVAVNAEISVFTTDGDFPHYAAVVPVKLYQPPESLSGIHDVSGSYNAR